MFDSGITASDDEPVLLRCYMCHLRHLVDIDTLPHEEFDNMKVTALSSQHQAVHPGLHACRMVYYSAALISYYGRSVIQIRFGLYCKFRSTLSDL